MNFKNHLNFLFNSIWLNGGNFILVGFNIWFWETAGKGDYSIQDVAYYYTLNATHYLLPAMLGFFYFRVYINSRKLKK